MIASKKEKSLSVLIAEADTLFSYIVRLEPADERGFITCFVTGVKVPWRESDAAHFVNRQHMNTRYDRMNVHATTVESNRFDDNHKDQYRKKMLEVYGLIRVDKLEARGRSLQKYSRSDLGDLIKAFKLQVKKLRKS